MPYPMDEVIENAVNGIAKAQRDYELWSGGNWLWEAPEYFMTTYIAKEISSYRKISYLAEWAGADRAAI